MSKYDYELFEDEFIDEFNRVHKHVINYLIQLESNLVAGSNPFNLAEQFKAKITLLSDDDEQFAQAIHDDELFKTVLCKGIMDEAKHSKQIHLMFRAYTAAMILLAEVGLLNENEPNTIKNYCSKNGKKGADARNELRLLLLEYALELAREYPEKKSGNSIAYEIQDKVLEKGKEIGYFLTPSNAQDTIQKWINKSRKKS